MVYASPMPTKTRPRQASPPTIVLAPNPQSPRLDDPVLDVMRRAIAQFLKDGNDPRVLPSVAASDIVELEGLYYVVLRNAPHEEPLKVYRLFGDRSLKGLNRIPRALREMVA